MCVSLMFTRRACVAVLAIGAVCLTADGAEPTFRDAVRRSLAPRKPAEEPQPTPGLPAELDQVVALEYSVLLRKEGADESVDPAKYSFQSGDQIRVRIQPLRDLYLYVFYEDATGRRHCLLPADRNTPWLTKREQPVELPTDGSVFEFDGKSGEEELTVVALDKPDDDLAAMCDLVCKKAENKLTVEERVTQGELRTRCQAMLKSIEDRQAQAARFRGVVTGAVLAKVSRESKQSGAAEIVLEEPPGVHQTGTLALSASKPGARAALVVTIPLKSGPATPDTIKSAKRP